MNCKQKKNSVIFLQNKEIKLKNMKFVAKGQWSLTVLDNMIMFELECMIVSLQDWINNSDCEQRTDQLPTRH